MNSKITISTSLVNITEETTLVGESDRINQVLVNCLEYFLEKNTRGSIMVEVKYDEKRLTLKFEIRDIGSGLKLEEFSRINKESQNIKSSASLGADKYLIRA